MIIILIKEIYQNALAISSYQSKEIKSYDDVQKKYDTVLQDKCINLKRPEYWGGFSFIPYYFEFWEGHEHRLIKELNISYLMEGGPKTIYSHE